MSALIDLKEKVRSHGVPGIARAIIRRLPFYRRICHHAFTRYAVSVDELSGQPGYYELPTESAFTIGPSPGDTSLPDYFARFVDSYRPRPRWVYSADKGHIVLPGPAILGCSKRPIQFTSRIDESLVYFWAKYATVENDRLILEWMAALRSVSGTASTNNPVFPLFGVWCTSYYHWITEYLPQIRGLEAYYRATNRMPKILLTSSPPTWMRQTLKCIGIGRDQWTTWDGNALQAPEVVISTHRVQTGGEKGVRDPSLDDFLWIRDRVLTGIGNGDAGIRRKIYISRQNERRRRVVNFDRVQSVLDSYGFIIVNPGNLSFEEQVRLFRTAGCIVGQHGAALTNLLFAPQNAKVIELLPVYEDSIHYFFISKMLGFEYYSIVSENTTEKDEDMVIDAEKLDDVLERVI